MIDLRSIRYVRIGTPDLGEATNFATKVLASKRPAANAAWRTSAAMTNAITRSATSRRSGAARDRVRSLGERRSASDRRRDRTRRLSGARGYGREREARRCWTIFRSSIRAVTRWRSCGARKPATAAIFRRATPGSPVSATSVCARPTRAVTKRFGRACSTRAQRLDRRGAALAHQRGPPHDRAVSEYVCRRAAHQPSSRDDRRRDAFVVFTARAARHPDRIRPAVTPRRARCFCISKRSTA